MDDILHTWTSQNDFEWVSKLCHPPPALTKYIGFNFLDILKDCITETVTICSYLKCKAWFSISAPMRMIKKEVGGTALAGFLLEKWQKTVQLTSFLIFYIHCHPYPTFIMPKNKKAQYIDHITNTFLIQKLVNRASDHPWAILHKVFFLSICDWTLGTIMWVLFWPLA